MSYQVNWEIQALDLTAGFLSDDPAGVAWETFLTTGQSIVYGDGTGERDARVVRDKQSACCVPEAAAIAAT